MTVVPPPRSRRLLTRALQAASAIDNFKIDSPVKKLDFDVADKENNPADEASLANLAEQMDNQKPEVEEVKKVEETKKVEKEEPATAVAPGIKPHEADEPILQENPGRFVLFPIKYHEVRDASPTRKVVLTALAIT